MNAATELPTFKHRPDLGVTLLSVAAPSALAPTEAIHINGTRAEQQAFLVALADAAIEAAESMSEQVPA